MTAKTEKLLPFDLAALLDSDEAISEYLSQVLEDGDSDELIRALGHIARARGMAQSEIFKVVVASVVKTQAAFLMAGFSSFLEWSALVSA